MSPALARAATRVPTKKRSPPRACPSFLLPSTSQSENSRSRVEQLAAAERTTRYTQWPTEKRGDGNAERGRRRRRER
jgi:hypothetical protein